MSEGIATKRHSRRARRNCRHHWMIETPHGATSRGVCKRCGARKRFPNAAEDVIAEGGRQALGRWANARRQDRQLEAAARESNEEAAI